MAITVDVSALEKSFGMLKEMRDTAKVPVDGLRFDPPTLENICLMFQLSHDCSFLRQPS